MEEVLPLIVVAFIVVLIATVSENNSKEKKDKMNFIKIILFSIFGSIIITILIYGGLMFLGLGSAAHGG